MYISSFMGLALFGFWKPSATKSAIMQSWALLYVAFILNTLPDLFKWTYWNKQQAVDGVQHYKWAGYLEVLQSPPSCQVKCPVSRCLLLWWQAIAGLWVLEACVQFGCLVCSKNLITLFTCIVILYVNKTCIIILFYYFTLPPQGNSCNFF